MGAEFTPSLLRMSDSLNPGGQELVDHQAACIMEDDLSRNRPIESFTFGAVEIMVESCAEGYAHVIEERFGVNHAQHGHRGILVVVTRHPCLCSFNSEGPDVVGSLAHVDWLLRKGKPRASFCLLGKRRLVSRFSNKTAI